MKRIQGQHIAQTNEDRFMAKTIPEPNSGCWLWMGKHQKTKYEYGIFYLNGSQTTAHRAAWRLFRGSIPQGFEIDHQCRNKTCVNPDHLWPMLKADNLATRVLTKSHCANGHQLSGDNVMVEVVKGRVARRCKTCRHRRNRK